MSPTILLYGAYGYTGTLIAKEAQQQEIPLMLAGRNEAKLKNLSEQTGHPYRVASLDELASEENARRIFEGITVVLHVAGPYVETATPMVNACLTAGIHYLDITGEWPVFEQLAAMDDAAKAANIMVLPGTGFDVVPSDCLAAFLKAQLPTATHLELAINPEGGLSHGTAVTAVVHANAGSRSRVNGELRVEKVAAHVREIPFSKKKLMAASIPWGDIVTAWHSTGIPNIRVFAAQPPKMIRMMKLTANFSWLMGWKPLNNLIRKRIDRTLHGPSAEMLTSGKSEVWGMVKDAEGNEVEARIQAPQAYALTAKTALFIAERVNKGNWTAGFQTPSSAYGADLILEACAARREVVSH